MDKSRRLLSEFLVNRRSRRSPPSGPRSIPSLTLLAPLLLGAVDVVFELDADLPLVRLVSDEGMLEQLLGGGPLGVVLHQAALDEAEELLGPVGKETRGYLNGRYSRALRRPCSLCSIGQVGRGILGACVCAG